MNVSHLRYAVEVEKSGSISAAAEKLYMGQPNLSKAIKELEKDIGMTLFTRTTKGVAATGAGRHFLQEAKRILAQLDQLEQQYVVGKQAVQRFSISVPRATYITYAFSRLLQKAPLMEEFEIHFKETSTTRALSGMLKHDFRLGILRYPLEHESYYQNLFADRGMKSREIFTYETCLLFSKDSQLVDKTKILLSDLEAYVELAHGDKDLPTFLPQNQTRSGTNKRKILIYERGSQFDLLSQMPHLYMWVSPLPEEWLKRYGLTQRKSAEPPQFYKDVLIYPKEYHLTELDNLFLEELLLVKRELSELS